MRLLQIPTAILFTSVIGLSSCEKLVTVAPPINKPTAGNLYATDEGSISAMTGMYAKMANNDFLAPNLFSLSLYAGVSADELTLNSDIEEPLRFYYSNNLSPATIYFPNTIWDNIYGIVFHANSVIEGLQASGTVSSQIKNQLLGEAKFMRAFCYFYLTSLYGNVPLVLTTDYKVNERMGRTKSADVIKQLIDDLEKSRELLAKGYIDGTLRQPSVDRVRPTTWAASSLLARVYLYTEQWAKANEESSKVINQTALFSLPVLQQAFKANNPEAIFQIQSIDPFRNTQDAWVFILEGQALGPQHPVFLSHRLVQGFSTTDLRLSNWIGKTTIESATIYYPHKYKALNEGTITEYQTVFRLAEQYLIRAEARAQLNQLDGADGAAADLNKIRQRAGLADYSGPTTKDSLLAAVLKERQLELFTEWGHRWFDLKRTKQIDSVMATVTTEKGGIWSGFRQLLPIANNEILYNNNLQQNPGY